MKFNMNNNTDIKKIILNKEKMTSFKIYMNKERAKNDEKSYIIPRLH
jgi:ribosomal protein S24E